MGKPGSELKRILDIPVTVSAVMGRTKLMVHELMQLGQGSVIELEKQAGEPAEILVEGRLIAKGELVVVNEHFGIKLNEILDPAERIRKLGGE
jgi:flagellar motor switch protein FliN/FliY